MNQLELKKLAKICKKKILLSKKNKNYFSQPFKHIVIDNFLTPELAKKSMNSFPKLSDPNWTHHKDKGIEVKSRLSWKSEFDIPENIIDVVRLFNSSDFLSSIGAVLSIPKLLPDPYFAGGGLNITEKGGHLDIHVDGNYHDPSGLNRRVNIILFLNRNWKKNWGGELGFYDNKGDELIKLISPIFNRCVIFDTHDKSFHGLPNPINFPKNLPRKSIILYYYTVAKRNKQNVLISKPHSALWKSKGLLDKKGKKTRKTYRN